MQTLPVSGQFFRALAEIYLTAMTDSDYESASRLISQFFASPYSCLNDLHSQKQNFTSQAAKDAIELLSTMSLQCISESMALLNLFYNESPLLKISDIVFGSFILVFQIFLIILYYI